MFDRLAEQLDKAKGEKVLLHQGLIVKIRTQDGREVGQGVISFVDPEVGVVTVVDSSGGADLHVDVDPKHYDLWVLPPESYKVPSPRDVSLYLRPSEPGPYAFSWY